MIWWHIKDCSLDPHFRCICKDCWIEAAGEQQQQQGPAPAMAVTNQVTNQSVRV
jgi:hypothetical protein